MYFAMIPKRSFLEDALVVLGVGAGIVLGSKYVLGDEKYTEYVGKAKNFVTEKTGLGSKSAESGAKDGHNPVSSKFSETSTFGPDTGMGIDDEEEEKAAEQETIMERIRRAANK